MGEQCQNDRDQCDQCARVEFKFDPDFSEEDQKVLKKIIEEETRLLLNGKCVKNDEVKKLHIIKDIHINIKKRYKKYKAKLDSVVNSMINAYLDSMENSYYYKTQVDVHGSVQGE